MSSQYILEPGTLWLSRGSRVTRRGRSMWEAAPPPLCAAAPDGVGFLSNESQVCQCGSGGVGVKINFVKRKPDRRTRGTDRLD